MSETENYMFCRVFPPTTPLHIINVIRKIQRAAVEFEFAERKKREELEYRRKNRKSKKFNDSVEWKKVREEAIKLYGNVCHRCGSDEQIQVDHIKPKSKYPELALDINNLQILCWPCNKHKSFRDETDYRNFTKKGRI